jgi:Phytanoyl-CoA dioxygenase (PhyH)
MLNVPAPHADTEPSVLLARADALEAAGRRDEAIAVLTSANREHLDAAVELRLAELRHAAFQDLDRAARFPEWHPAVSTVPVVTRGVPELPRNALTADAVRANVLAHGSVLVRRYVPPPAVEAFVDGIDAAFEIWSSLRRPYAKPTGSPWFESLPLDETSKASLGRTWVTNGAGLLIADSPRLLFMLLETFESLGLREVVTEYLGERPVMSANKCTLRRVPVDTNAGWHQDGAFLGADVRALNVWLALSDCGIDAPSLDIVPRRFDGIVETGTHGSYFDWAVGAELVDDIAQETPVIRPVFAAGDVLMFDDKLLHRTATDPSMSRPRYAIETWFFAPSYYPEGHVPLVW